MRAVIQRVTNANVVVNGTEIGAINSGLMVLMGVQDEDTFEDMEWLCTKIANQRIFSDEEGKMNKSLLDIGGEILLISQFTLFAQTKKGNRPSFIKAARPDKAIPMYNESIEFMKSLVGKDKVASGEFGADMKVSLVNDGPVTIVMDTKNRE